MYTTLSLETVYTPITIISIINICITSKSCFLPYLFIHYSSTILSALHILIHGIDKTFLWVCRCVLVLFPFYRWEKKVTERQLVAQDELSKGEICSLFTFCLIQSCWELALHIPHSPPVCCLTKSCVCVSPGVGASSNSTETLFCSLLCPWPPALCSGYVCWT